LGGKTYINIKDVLYIGEQYYEFGKPAEIEKPQVIVLPDESAPF
jgi:hypothetical protein